MTRLQRTVGVLGIGIVLLVGLAGHAEQDKHVLIVELQTGSTESAGAEFIELFNVANGTRSLDGFLVQYKSSTGDTWQTKAQLSGLIAAHSRLTVSTEGVQVEGTPVIMKSGLAATGGHVRVVQQNESNQEFIHDALGWGVADSSEGQSALPHETGQSLKRKTNEDGNFIDTDSNGNDFFASADPSPTSDPQPVDESSGDNSSNPTDEIISEADPDPNTGEGLDDSPDSQSEGIQTGQNYAGIHITELLPNPAAPKTDTDDEFVELFNPNNFSVNIQNYILQTGKTYSYSFTLPDITLLPQQYLALYSIDTNLTLSNTEGKARILDPAENVLHETDGYGKADEDVSWALVEGKWQWTSTPTPNAANSLASVASSKSNKSSKSSTAKSKSSGSSKGKSGSKSTDGEDRQPYEDPAAAADSPLNKTILAGIGSMAVMYAGWEYRQDIGNKTSAFIKKIRALIGK